MGMPDRSTAVRCQHVLKGGQTRKGVDDRVGTCASGIFTAASNFLALWISGLHMAFIRCIKQRAGARRRVRFKYSRYNKRETEAPYSSFVAYLLRLPFFLSPDFPPHLPSPPKLNARRSNVSRYFNLAEAGYNTDTDMDTRHRVQEVHS